MAAIASRLTHLVAIALAVGAIVACSATAGDGAGPSGTTSGTGGSDTGGAASTGGNGASGGDINIGGLGGSGGAPVCTQNIDIVFVMDVSTSMGPFLTKLAEEMPAVDAAVQALNLESTPQYGLVVFVDDVMFANSAQPYANVGALQSEFQSWASFTSTNTQVSGGGYNSTWPENSLDALHAAATQFPWRPEAETLRVVIHTTDDTFWQGPTTADGESVVYDYASTVTALQQAQVRVFSFAAQLGGPLETDPVGAGWFGPYGASPSIPDSTGGGVFELGQVLSGQISLSASITDSVEETFCDPYPVPN